MSVHGRLNEHRTDRKLYECTDCLEHHTSTERVVACPNCGGTTENLTKPRAE